MMILSQKQISDTHIDICNKLFLIYLFIYLFIH